MMNKAYLRLFNNIIKILDHCRAKIRIDAGAMNCILQTTATDLAHPTVAKRTAAG